jgi:hypothetical protein
MKLEWPIDAQQAKMQRESEDFVLKYLASKEAEKAAESACRDMRLRGAHAVLLAAAMRLVEIYDQPAGDIPLAVERLKAAVAKAEELEP